MPASAIAATPASSRCSRWSADSALKRAASAAPPRLLSCSAWSLTRRPCSVAASNSALDLVRREGDALAKGIDAGGQAGARDGRDHLVDRPCRHNRRACRQSRAAARGARAGSATIRTGSWLPSALAALSMRSSAADVEAVARLDLDRGAAAGHQRVQARRGPRRAVRRPSSPPSRRRSRRCRRRPWRSPHRSRRRGAWRARRRGCRRRPDGCGSRSARA